MCASGSWLNELTRELVEVLALSQVTSAERVYLRACPQHIEIE